MSVNAGLLPRDVLVEIFSYCSYYDLVESIQYVCRWWQEVSWEKSLWQKIEYSSLSDSKERIINFFRKSPFLRAVDLALSSSRDVEIYKELIVNCPYLEVLSISWESVQDAFINCSITEPLTTVKTLKLNAIEDKLINVGWIHGQFPNVEHLEIKTYIIYNELDFAQFLRVKQDVLHTLYLPCSTEYGNCVLQYLSVCTSLKILTLTDLCVRESSPTNALRFNTISVLKLIYSFLDVNCLNHFPNVVHLQLTNCIYTDGDFLDKLGLCCPTLSQFTICDSFCSPYPEDNNLTQLNYFKRLTHLCIWYNVQITDKGVDQLKHLPNLIKLDLYKCDLVTPMCLKVICTFSILEVLKFDLKNSTVDLIASDVENRDLQFMFYNCPHEMLEWFRKQHLRVCILGEMNNKYVC